MFRFRIVSKWGASPESRAALVKTLNDIKIDDLGEIAKKLPELGIPISIIYGEKDIWLASEMRRIKQEIPESNITGIPNCGHFGLRLGCWIIPDMVGIYLIQRMP